MIRFILKRTIKDAHSGFEGEDFYTLDIDVPEIEAALTRGGYGGSGYENHQLIGTEILGQE